MNNPRLSTVPLVIVSMMVGLAGMGTGMLFGSFIGGVVGMTVAGAGGFLAGIVWCQLMQRMHRRITSTFLLFFWGGAFGLGVGLADTVLLHAVLLAVSKDLLTSMVIFGGGLVCAAVAGPVVGVISSAVWLMAKNFREPPW